MRTTVEFVLLFFRRASKRNRSPPGLSGARAPGVTDCDSVRHPARAVPRIGTTEQPSHRRASPSFYILQLRRVPERVPSLLDFDRGSYRGTSYDGCTRSRVTGAPEALERRKRGHRSFRRGLDRGNEAPSVLRRTSGVLRLGDPVFVLSTFYHAPNRRPPKEMDVETPSG